MTDNELLAVMDREAALLDADNWHASATVMREAAALVRRRNMLAACRLDVSGTAALSDYERAARIADAIVGLIPRGLGSAHGAEGQRIMSETAEWIATEIRSLASRR